MASIDDDYLTQNERAMVVLGVGLEDSVKAVCCALRLGTQEDMAGTTSGRATSVTQFLQ